MPSSASISISPGRGGARRGAGRPPTRELVDDFPSVDIRDWWWSLEVAGLKAVCRPGAELRVRLGAEAQDEVAVTASPSGSCKSRAWFVCPSCGGWVAKLYRRAAFACRRCSGLAYPSQRSSMVKRALALEGKLAARLAPGLSRPRRMHRSTYDRILATLVLASNMRIRGLARQSGDHEEVERLKEGAGQLRSAIAAMRHKATRPPVRSEESVKRLLAMLAI